MSSIKTLVDVFWLSCEKFADRTCFIMRPKYRTVRWTFSDFYNYSVLIAQFLQKRGLKKGDRALLLAPNSPWWQAVFWGCQLAGVIPVPLMVQSRSEFVGKVASQTRAKILLKASFVKKPRHVSCPALDIDMPDFYIQPRFGQDKKHSNILQNVRMFFSLPEEDDIAEILYTSGTTGEPKGVPLSHKNIVSNLKAILPLVPIRIHYKTVSILPLSHILEQMAELVGLVLGATTVYIPSLSSTAVTEAMKEHKPMVIVTVPEFLRLFWRRIEAEMGQGLKASIFHFLLCFAAILPWPLRRLLFLPVHSKFGWNLWLIVTGGAALDPELARKWQLFGFFIMQGYGLTETAPILTTTPFLSSNIKSVGKALPGVELKVASDGEVLARGPNVFLGYWKNPEKTKEAFDGSWFRTGDIGYFDKKGFLYLTGKKKFMILTESGQNVYPEDLEAELNKERGVEDSCVVGLEKKGRVEIHAVLLGKISDPEKIIASVNRRLASFQQIQSWSLWPFSDFPRTATQKIIRQQVLDYLKKNRAPLEPEFSERKGAAPLITILAEISGMPASKIRPDTKIVADLKLDSLGRIEFVAQCEKKFGVEIDEAKITYETRVKDLEKLIQEKPRKKVKYRLRHWPRSSLVVFLREILHKIILVPLSWIYIKLEVRGQENIRQVSLPCIFMANHLSDLDTFSVIMALPDRIKRRLTVAAATDVLFERYKFLQPLLTFFVASYPFPRKGQVSLGLIHTGKLLDQGWSILVFPEGQISPKGDLLPFKLGAGVLAVDMEVPVVPVKITGTNKILPLHWRLPYPRTFRGRVEVVFGKPLYFGKKTAFEKARKEIENTIRKL